MIATIFHEDSKSKLHFPDMVTAQGATIEELRDNALLEVQKRGWNPDDCWSKLYGTDEEINHD
jgi:hypothetical protein